MINIIESYLHLPDYDQYYRELSSLTRLWSIYGFQTDTQGLEIVMITEKCVVYNPAIQTIMYI